MDLATRALSTAPDLRQAADLVHHAFTDAYSDLLSTEALLRASPDWFLGQWTEPAAQHSRLVGGFIDGVLASVARIGVDPERAGSGHLFSLYVSPASQGRGLGRAMLSVVRDAWAALAYTEATLWVFRDNKPARALYVSDGWVPTGQSRIEDEWQAAELQLLTQVRP